MSLFPPFVDIPKTGRVSRMLAARLMRRLDIKMPDRRLEEFRRGLEVEREHVDVTGGDAVTTARIVMAHLREKPNYYTLLDKYVER